MDQGWVAVPRSQARGQVGVVRGLQGMGMGRGLRGLVSGSPAPQAEASAPVQTSTIFIAPSIMIVS